MADTLIFMKIPGINGESSATGYAHQIELEGVDWGMSLNNRTSHQSANSKAPEFKLGTVQLQKFYDLASGTLLTRAKLQSRADPKSPNPKKPKYAFESAEIHYVDLVVDSDGEQKAIPVVAFTLTKCFINKVDVSVQGSGKTVQIKESIDLEFGTIKMVYFQRGDDTTQRGEAMTFSAEAPMNKDDPA